MEKPEKLEDQIYFDPLAICQGCGKPGAFVYYTGDIFCFSCMGVKVVINIPVDSPIIGESKNISSIIKETKELNMDPDPKDKKADDGEQKDKPDTNTNIETTDEIKRPHFVLVIHDSVMNGVSEILKE